MVTASETKRFAIEGKELVGFVSQRISPRDVAADRRAATDCPFPASSHAFQFGNGMIQLLIDDRLIAQELVQFFLSTGARDDR